MVRQAGRLYGRFTRLKSELLSEFTRAAEIPPPVPGAPTSIRQSLLNWEPSPGRTIGIPAAVMVAPTAGASPGMAPDPAPAPLGPPTWSDTAGGGSTWSRSEP